MIRGSFPDRREMIAVTKPARSYGHLNGTRTGSQPATGCRFSARPSMASHEKRAFSLFESDLRENAGGATNVLRK